MGEKGSRYAYGGRGPVCGGRGTSGAAGGQGPCSWVLTQGEACEPGFVYGNTL